MVETNEPGPRVSARPESADASTGRSRLSTAMITVGSVLLLLAAVVIITNRTFLDTDRFANSVNEIRTLDSVSAALADQLTDGVLETNPDLVAVRPVITQVAQTVVSSDLLSPLVRTAAAEAQKAATTPDSQQIVLRVADVGSVVSSVLQTLAPELAATIPSDLSLTLAEVGSQNVFTDSVAISEILRVLGLVLPLAALAMLVAGVWLAPNQRRGIVRAGIGTMAAGIVLGVLLLTLGVVAASLDTSTLGGALADGAWTVFSLDYWLAAGLLVVLGALLASAAAALLPDIDVDEIIRRVGHVATTRPASVEGAALRGVIILLVGVGLLVSPLRLLSWAAILVGLAVLAYGVSEITQAALSSKSGETDRGAAGQVADAAPPGRGGLIAVVGFALVSIVGLGVWLTLDVSDESASAEVTPAGPVDTCNGHRELCGRGYDEVAYVTSHNAMSAADQPGWFLAEQPHGIIDQLDGGVRGLMIDVWEGQPTETAVSSLPGSIEEGRAQLDEAFGPEQVDAALRVAEQTSGEPVGEPELFMCHGLCEIGATNLADTLDDIGTWLDANPGEVVSIIVENHVPAKEIGAAFATAGLEPQILEYDGKQFPTLGEMLGDGHQLVVTTETGSGGPDYPWLQNAFDLTQDTPYTFAAPKDFSCELNRGTKESPLFLVNHWLASFRALVTDAERVNAAQVLGPRLAECQEKRGMLPNFVGVNYYDIGDVAAEVDTLNGVD